MSTSGYKSIVLGNTEVRLTVYIGDYASYASTDVSVTLKLEIMSGDQLANLSGYLSIINGNISTNISMTASPGSPSYKYYTATVPHGSQMTLSVSDVYNTSLGPEVEVPGEGTRNMSVLTLYHIPVRPVAPSKMVTVSGTPSGYGTTYGGGSYSVGTWVTISASPYEGYKFNYWTLSPGGINYNSSYSFSMPDYDVNAVATFEPITYYINYDYDGGTGGINKPTTGTWGSNVQISNPTKTGYTFAGWTSPDVDNTTAKTGSTSSSVSTTWGGSATTNQYFKNLTADHGNTVHFIATWTAKTTSITLDRNGGSGGDSSTIGTYGSPLPAITVPTRTNYTFEGYWDDKTGGTQYYSSAGKSKRNWDKTESSVTLYARWVAGEVILTYDGQGAQAEPDDESYIVNTTATVSTTKPVRKGYHFVTWNTKADGTGTNRSPGSTFTITANTALYAIWWKCCYVCTSSGWLEYIPYVCTSSGWLRYEPYIATTSGWK